jgi:alpha-methylacyl-CoA racemase
LHGIRVVELGGIGPTTFAAMVLADLGADVLRIERPQSVAVDVRPPDFAVTRGRRSVAIDLKSPRGSRLVLDLLAKADIAVEGWRPGVAERIGVGPTEAMKVNQRLVYVRVTGWGQDGPYAQGPGHDINYLAVTGALHAIGRRDSPPVPPLNIVGDYGAGGMIAVVGALAALWEAKGSGRGQVVDAAMVDGIALLTTLFHGMLSTGFWTEDRERNTVDGGAPWYDSYETSDGKYVCVGAGEPHFFNALLDLLDLTGQFADPMDRATWPEMRAKFTERFLTRTRADWTADIGDRNLCLAPVLTWREATDDPHLRHRGTFVAVDGVVQPAPAPRFSRTPTTITRPAPWPGEHSSEGLTEWGIDADALGDLIDARVVVQRGRQAVANGNNAR